TSMDASDMGIDKSPEEIVVQRAKLAAECGCDGVVASGREASVIKKETEGKLFVVCPGIRPAGYDTGLHKRHSTPYQAIKSGADYLVVGRPIRDAPSPSSAALAILEEMKNAF
ncbi:MAG: orotidine 5'-phosphate decarboxylase, partial [Candidatus Omnitrophica bacterium]|nr:orotidine 5'-phosphate decarboxylase [Candidatus Omnitrophota bacterium]